MRGAPANQRKRVISLTPSRRPSPQAWRKYGDKTVDNEIILCISAYLQAEKKGREEACSCSAHASGRGGRFAPLDHRLPPPPHHQIQRSTSSSSGVSSLPSSTYFRSTT